MLEVRRRYLTLPEELVGLLTVLMLTGLQRSIAEADSGVLLHLLGIEQPALGRLEVMARLGHHVRVFERTLTDPEVLGVGEFLGAVV
jgi:hypothetical protein